MTKQKATEHRVQLTCGILRVFQAFFLALSFFYISSRIHAHPRS
jgi:hypothetical protein